jgi:hypothetical protein
MLLKIRESRGCDNTAVFKDDNRVAGKCLKLSNT